MNSIESGFNSERDIPRLFVQAIGALAVYDEVRADLQQQGDRHPEIAASIKLRREQEDDPSSKPEIVILGSVRGRTLYKESRAWGDRWKTRHLYRSITGLVSSEGHSTEVNEINHSVFQNHRQLGTGFNIAGITNLLLSVDTEYKPVGLANTAIELGSARVTSAMKQFYYRHIIDAFAAHGDLPLLLDRIAEQPESNGRSGFISSLNRRIRSAFTENISYNSAANQNSAIQLLDALDERNLIDIDALWSVPLHVNPYAASVVASVEGLGKNFDKYSSHARRQMGFSLIEKLLDEYAQPYSDRNQHNAALIKQTIFDSSSYHRDLPLLELIKLSNQFTQRLNQSKSKEEQRPLLPVNGIGTTMLLNSGEAVFRILNMTSRTPEHIAHDRDIATIFDALLEADYRRFAKSRPVTVADICARYPDAKGDLVFELQESARTSGYSAASNLYKKTRREQGKRVFFDKHKAGRGVIS